MKTNDGFYSAVASEDLMLNDTVIIVDEFCRRPTFSEAAGKELFSVVDVSVKNGERATLSGADTVMSISEDV